MKNLKTYKEFLFEQTKDKIKNGKGDNLTPEDVAKHHKVNLEVILKELELGLEIEKEHSADIKLRNEISLDHLMEDPHYYTKAKSEDWAKAELDKEKNEE